MLHSIHVAAWQESGCDVGCCSTMKRADQGRSNLNLICSGTILWGLTLKIVRSSRKTAGTSSFSATRALSRQNPAMSWHGRCYREEGTREVNRIGTTAVSLHRFKKKMTQGEPSDGSTDQDEGRSARFGDRKGYRLMNRRTHLACPEVRPGTFLKPNTRTTGSPVRWSIASCSDQGCTDASARSLSSMFRRRRRAPMGIT